MLTSVKQKFKMQFFHVYLKITTSMPNLKVPASFKLIKTKWGISNNKREPKRNELFFGNTLLYQKFCNFFCPKEDI